MSFDILVFLGQIAGSSPPHIAAIILGIITSLSPCPLGANLTALAIVTKNSKSKFQSFIGSFVYSLGRAFTYVIIALLFWFMGTTFSEHIGFLFEYSEIIFGIILIVSGLILLGKINFNLNLFDMEKLSVFKDKGLVGDFLLGVGLALVFCPVSMALYFGGLLPLTVVANDPILIPTLYGVGSAIIIFLAPMLITLSSKFNCR